MSNNSQKRQQLYTLLGELPGRHRPISAEVLVTREYDGYLLETLRLDLNGIEPVPAFFARPSGGDGPFPAILYNHAHGDDYALGKDELLHGRPILQAPAYGKALTEAGYAVLCIDAWVFGERENRSESALFKEMLWKGRVLWGHMVYDSLRALDYLAGRAEVDSESLGTLGMSMGSTMAWWLAALDTRIKVCVDICCLTDFQALIESGGLDHHGVYYYVPDLLKHFSAAEINALIAPRAHLALAGNLDPLTPPIGLEQIDAHLRDIYAAEGVPEAWQLHREDVGHEETPAMRMKVIDFLLQWL